MHRSMTLRTQLMLWQIGTALVVVVVLLATGLIMQWVQLRDAYVDRALGVANSVAELPSVREAFHDEDPSRTIQPLAELIRKASSMTYVVVTDANGVRFSHPDTSRIGKRVSTPPSAAQSGEVFTGRETGTLGTTWRAKVPVRNDEGAVIGQVSVGILDSELFADVLDGTPWQFGVTAFAALVSAFGAAATARIFHRRTLGLQPEQIAGLLEGREAILHGSRDGIIAVDTRDRLVLVNDAALQLLGLTPEAALSGTDAAVVLPAELLAQLETANGDDQLHLVGERRLLVRADAVSYQGEPTGRVLLVRDHTELHETLAELEGAHSATEQLRGQTHEFQNQLHIVGGLLELGDTDAARDFVRRLNQGGELSRLDAAPGTEVDPELGALLLMKRGVAAQRDITITDAGLSAWPLVAEASTELRDDLLTVTANLIDNAIDACAVGGSLRLTVERAGSELLLTVDDTGPGVPLEDRESIFTPGVSSKASPTPRGFGLSLVRRISERLGGGVAVSDGPLGGARFVAHIPLQEVHA